ncbi:cysteine hydrolase [Methanospirillum stamsii]|uniref:Cysteine hydrolase n=1 Tax=Methanospirillum stamsii TaxID=1277351 RepID=A0A2V2MRV2_9EURY|nr:cysteine hydrolase [Methanospirillum stamsii]
MKTAVLLIDIQNDYFPGGAMECVKSIKAGENAGKILQWARDRRVIPIHIRHISTRPGASFFLPGTVGSEIHELVSPLSGERIIIKNFPNSFRETNLEEILRENNIERLIITGMMTHMCIDTTTRAATDLGYSCILIHDACATRELTFEDERVPSHYVHASFISSLSGLYARIFSTEEFLSNQEFNPS